MHRAGIALLLVAVAGLSTGVTVLLYRPEARPPLEPSPGSAWDRWRQLPDSQRQAHVQRYRLLAQRPDVADVLQRARRFAALPVSEQERLRAAHALLAETLAGRSAAQRMSLLSLHQRARAEAVYQILEAEAPQRLAELRERWGGRS